MFYTTAHYELCESSPSTVSWFTVQSVCARRNGSVSERPAMSRDRKSSRDDTPPDDSNANNEDDDIVVVEDDESGSTIDDSLLSQTSRSNNNSSHSRNDSKVSDGRSESWWSYGSRKYGPPSSLIPTHRSARYSMTGERAFAAGGRRGAEDVWDLSDSLAELYERDQRRAAAASRSRSGVDDSSSSPGRVDVQSWLVADPGNGFVRVFAPGGVDLKSSRLVPCTLTTTAQKICLQLGVSGASLHVQLSGDAVRRLEPHDQPLAIQNEYLLGLGFTNVAAVQAEGINEELVYLIKFYSGKPVHDSTFTRKQLKSWINVKKAGLLQQWVQRLCVLSGTRLLVFKDRSQREEPQIIQLVKGSVEPLRLKGHELTLKLTSTHGGEKIIFLEFTNSKEFNRWLRRCKKATDKLPTVADLSCCQLEYLPENVFVNDQLTVLNLQHNALRERPVDEDDIYLIGWLDDLVRFEHLRVLNLADNELRSFPLSLCAIATLTQLNLASNKLEEIPPEISALKNLEELHLHNNHLSSLPGELTALRRLFILVLAFNRFTEIPAVLSRMTNIDVSEVANVIMAGNQIERIERETILEMSGVKKLDLRMNRLVLPVSETVHMSALEHLTHLVVCDNKIAELDIRAIRTLEYLNCERNAMASLQVNGTALRNLFASCNCLENFVISPKPEWLLQLDVSDNCLESLPDWMSDCFFLQKLYVNKNFLTALPPMLLMNAKKMKYLRVGHNYLTSLPDEVDSLLLEELQIQHNVITHLPAQLFIKANKLRVLNATKNRLTTLPQLNENDDLNKLQELYLSGNSLNNSALQIISGFSRLKVLHLAQNELTELNENEIKKLDMLYELNVSTNQLSSLPASLGELPKLVVLRAHSNCLCNLPDFHDAKALRVLDVGHNQLMNVSVTHLMASQISLLDMSLNTQLKVDPQEYKALRCKKSVCLVDLTGQDRQLPGLNKKGRLPSIDEHFELDESLPWKVGFSETSGIRNKLCISILKTLRFNADNESLFGMFDGGRNADAPKLIVSKVGDVLRDAMSHHNQPADFMKYAMLTMHRKLRSTGQRLGASGILIHLQRTVGEGKMNQFAMNVANVGDVEAVLCRHGEAQLLTRKFVTTSDRDECHRVCLSDGIITEDGKVNGTTICTRQLGCSYLYPHVTPDPYVLTVTLRADDEFIVVANSALWDVISPEDVVEEIYEIGNPVVAAKHIQDLAQGFGATENLSVLVIRLNTDRGPSLARLRPTPHVMSIDDVEAALAHDAAQRARRAARDAGASSETSASSSARHFPVVRQPPPSTPVPAAAALPHHVTRGPAPSPPRRMLPEIPTAAQPSTQQETVTSASGQTLRLSFTESESTDNMVDPLTPTNSRPSSTAAFVSSSPAAAATEVDSLRQSPKPTQNADRTSKNTSSSNSLASSSSGNTLRVSFTTGDELSSPPTSSCDDVQARDDVEICVELTRHTVSFPPTSRSQPPRQLLQQQQQQQPRSDKPPPIAPKPRFVKKGGTGSTDRSSQLLSRTRPHSVVNPDTKFPLSPSSMSAPSSPTDAAGSPTSRQTSMSSGSPPNIKKTPSSSQEQQLQQQQRQAFVSVSPAAGVSPTGGTGMSSPRGAEERGEEGNAAAARSQFSTFSTVRVTSPDSSSSKVDSSPVSPVAPVAPRFPRSLSTPAYIVSPASADRSLVTTIHVNPSSGSSAAGDVIHSASAAVTQGRRPRSRGTVVGLFENVEDPRPQAPTPSTMSSSATPPGPVRFFSSPYRSVAGSAPSTARSASYDEQASRDFRPVGAAQPKFQRQVVEIARF